MHKLFISKRQMPQHYKFLHFVVSFNVLSGGEIAFTLVLANTCQYFILKICFWIPYINYKNMFIILEMIPKP